MWPLIEEAWTDLCEWTIYFVRHLQLARQPDLAFTFLMLNSGERESLHSETSPHDDDWVTKLPVPQGVESPLDVLLPAHGDDAAAEALWERLRTAPPRPRQRPRCAQPPLGARRLPYRGRGRRRRRAPGHWLCRVGRPLPAGRGQPAPPAALALRRRGAPAAKGQGGALRSPTAPQSAWPGILREMETSKSFCLKPPLRSASPDALFLGTLRKSSEDFHCVCGVASKNYVEERTSVGMAMIIKNVRSST
jgi:hypothetical protein